MESEVFEQTRSLREDGFRPAEIGLLLLWRTVRGAPADASWACGVWYRSRHRAKRVRPHANLDFSGELSMQVFKAGTVEGDRLLRSIRHRMIHSPSGRDHAMEEYFLSNWDNISEVEVRPGSVVLRIGTLLRPDPADGPSPICVRMPPVRMIPLLTAMIVRGWTWIYTCRLPRDVLRRRRMEIESDLWDHIQAAYVDGQGPWRVAVAILSRWCRGILDDVRWSSRERACVLMRRIFPSPIAPPHQIIGIVLVLILGAILFSVLKENPPRPDRDQAVGGLIFLIFLALALMSIESGSTAVQTTRSG